MSVLSFFGVVLGAWVCCRCVGSWVLSVGGGWCFRVFFWGIWVVLFGFLGGLFLGADGLFVVFCLVVSVLVAFCGVVLGCGVCCWVTGLCWCLVWGFWGFVFVVCFCCCVAVVGVVGWFFLCFFSGFSFFLVLVLVFVFGCYVVVVFCFRFDWFFLVFFGWGVVGCRFV